jgi:hypothetical protein
VEEVVSLLPVPAEEVVYLSYLPLLEEGVQHHQEGSKFPVLPRMPKTMQIPSATIIIPTVLPTTTAQEPSMLRQMATNRQQHVMLQPKTSMPIPDLPKTTASGRRSCRTYLAPSSQLAKENWSPGTPKLPRDGSGGCHIRYPPLLLHHHPLDDAGDLDEMTWFIILFMLCHVVNKRVASCKCLLKSDIHAIFDRFLGAP